MTSYDSSSRLSKICFFGFGEGEESVCASSSISWAFTPWLNNHTTSAVYVGGSPQLPGPGSFLSDARYNNADSLSTTSDVNDAAGISRGLCRANCAVCSEPDECDVCNAGYYLLNEICYYECTPYCIECDYDVCVSCVDTHRVEDGACLINCVDGTYPSADESECLDCDIACDLCTEDARYGCTRCTYGHFLWPATNI